MFTDMLQNMSESQKQIFVDHFGSVEAWEQHMMETASDERVQKNYAKVVEWYGEKSLEELRLGDEKSLSCLTAPMSGFYKTMRSQPNLTKNSKICKLRLVDRRSLLFYD